MNSVATNGRRVKHRTRVSGILPTTEEREMFKLWGCFYLSSRQNGHSEDVAYNSANLAVSLLASTPEAAQSWYSRDPQNGRVWSGSKPATRYEPWSGDYSDVEPAWNREDWVGA